MPLLCELVCQGKVLSVVGYAWLNHCTLKPFIKRCDGDPIRRAGECARPTAAIGRAVVARDNISSCTPRHACIIVAWQDTRRPDLLCMVLLIIAIDLLAKALIDLGNIVVLDAPVGRAKEMDAIKDAQQAVIHALGGPDRLIVWIDLLADGAPIGKRAVVAEGMPEEKDWLAVPVKEVRVIGIMSHSILKSAHNLRRAVKGGRVALKVDAGGKGIPGCLL